MGINNFVGTGNVVRDPEITKTGTGKAIASFTIAIKRNYKSQTGDYEADFINCVAFGATAELIGKWVKKSSKLGVVGSLQSGAYTKEDGTKAYSTKCIVASIDFQGKMNSEEQAERNEEENKGMLSIDVDDSSLTF